jgi:hypothetical protein
MTPDEDTPFERRARELLREAAAGTSGPVRSRLTRARHAALEEARRRSARPAWVLPGMLPAAGTAAAAVLVGVLLVTARGPGAPQVPAFSPGAFEDFELLADAEGLEMLEQFDRGFLEWAAAEAERLEERG